QVVTLAAGSGSPVINKTVTALAGGGFLVSWTDTGTGDRDIMTQRFDAAGAKIGSAFTVNTVLPGDQYAPAVAALSDGGFVIAWIDFSQSKAFAQVFDAAGQRVGGEFAFAQTTGNAFFFGSLQATLLASGDIALSWSSNEITGADTSGLSVRTAILTP